MTLSAAGLIFLSLAVTSAVLAGLLCYQEIGEVNRHLPDSEQVPYLIMYPGKMQKISAAYKRHYPNGRVNIWRIIFQTDMFLFLALTALAGGFLR